MKLLIHSIYSTRFILNIPKVCSVISRDAYSDPRNSRDKMDEEDIVST